MKIDNNRLLQIALIPSIIVGVCNFGWHALVVIALSVGTVVLCDSLYHFIIKKKIKIDDGNIVIALLMALVLPPMLNWYHVIIASAFAFLVGKLPFSYNGSYHFNPVLIAKAFMVLTFAGPMSHFVFGGEVATTPLSNLMNGESVNTMELFLGNTAGNIGMTSALGVFLGALFLIMMDVIRIETPLGVLAGYLIITLISGQVVEGMSYFHYIVAELCSGGVLFGAFFLATEPKLLPKKPVMQIVYGLFIGMTAANLRFIGNSLEGITFAILAGNALLLLSNIIEEAKAGKYRRGVEENDEAKSKE